MKPTTKNAVEVIGADDIWSQFGTPLPPRENQSNIWTIEQRSSRIGAWTFAAVLTVLIHTLIFAPFVFGTAGRKFHPPLTEGAATSAENKEASKFVSVLISLDNRSITDSEAHDDSAYEVVKEVDRMAQQSAPLAELSSTSQPEISGSEEGKDENSEKAEAVGNETGRALLFGRYMGQVKARIERAWDYPAAPFKGKFQCKVQISQSEHGDVREVTLQRCNGDSLWQKSLVLAIQQSSPLPAPPSEDVFTSVLTLSFEAELPANLLGAAEK